jgi:AraC-like DNA-binding protein
MPAGFSGEAAVSDDAVIIALKLDSGPSWKLSGQHVTDTELVVFSPRTEYCLRTAAAGEWAMVQLDARSFEQCIGALSGQSYAPARSLVRLLRPATNLMHEVRRSIRAIRDFAAVNIEGLCIGGVRHAFEQQVLLSLGRIIGTEDRPVQTTHARVARAAMRYLDDHVHDPIYLSNLSIATGFSERTLRRAFDAMYQMSPMAFLRIRRLNQARRTLLTERGASVTGVAMRYGFFDVGRFAHAYRQLFAELPSETLRSPVSR